MKKAFVTTVLIALMAAPALAQSSEGPRFGLKFSPNLSWMRPDSKELKSEGTRLGYSFGLLMEFPIGEQGNYRFATGAFLYNQGGKFSADHEYRTAPGAALQTKNLITDIKLRYVEVPLTMKLMTSEIGYIRYYGQIGFSAAFNIRAKADQEVPVYDVSGVYTTGFENLTDEDIKDNINLFKAGLIVGGGLEFNFSGNTSLLAGITYNNSFTNVLKDVEYNGKKAKAYNDYIELTVGVFF